MPRRSGVPALTVRRLPKPLGFPHAPLMSAAHSTAEPRLCHNQRSHPLRGELPYECIHTSSVTVNGGPRIPVCSWCADGMPFAEADAEVRVEEAKRRLLTP